MRFNDRIEKSSDLCHLLKILVQGYPRVHECVAFTFAVQMVSLKPACTATANDADASGVSLTYVQPRLAGRVQRARLAGL